MGMCVEVAPHAALFAQQYRRADEKVLFAAFDAQSLQYILPWERGVAADCAGDCTTCAMEWLVTLD